MRLTTLQNLRLINHAGLHFANQNDKILRIAVLNHDLIRVQFCPDGQPRLSRTWTVVGGDGDVPREGRLRDDLTPFPQPAYQQTQDAETVTIQTDALKLVVNLKSAHLEWHSAEGHLFAGDLRHRAYTYDRSGRSVYHYLQRRTDEHYFGFGERSGTLDKRGRRFRMVNVDALGYNAETSDPLYKHVPFYITYIPSQNIAYGLFYDNLAATVFDLGHEIDAFWGYYRYWMAEDGDLDYYLIYGPTIADVVQKFTALTGKPALLPRWALGYLGSTMSYTEASNAQTQLKRFVELCAQHEIPCDLFHLSSGYTTDDTGRRFVFTWNRKRIPAPEQMVQDFHAAGIRLAPNIKPYLLTTHPQYAALRAAGGFICDPDTGEPVLSRFWSGGAFESEEGSYVDFSSEAGFNWWQAQAHAALLSLGIDALWNDNNEFEIWDDEARCDGYGDPIRISMARPLQTLLMARASYAAVLAQHPEQRPFILSRSACAGMQRYVQTWSGDNETSWHSLRYNIPMGLNMGLSGMPNIGHDVGGFFGPAPSPELFVRWVQNGIFHPRFTIHSWNTDGTVNEPWMYPEVLPIVRALIELRYRLLPFLYTLMFEAHQTGSPIIRPLVYHFPHDPRCHTESFDFLLGSHVLVASVLEDGARKRRVYLPGGTWWCDFYTGQWHEGGQAIEVDAPLDRIPLFVADGGMLPMGTVMRHVGEGVDDQREVYVFTRSHATFTLVEDDGVSLDYRHGAFTTVELSMTLMDGQLAASARMTHAGYPLPYDRVTFIVATDAPTTVRHATLENGRWRVTVPLIRPSTA
jgi:alpha-glucosidase